MKLKRKKIRKALPWNLIFTWIFRVMTFLASLAGDYVRRNKILFNDIKIRAFI